MAHRVSRAAALKECVVLQDELHAFVMVTAARDVEAGAMRPLSVHIGAMLDAELHEARVALGGGTDEGRRPPVIGGVDGRAEAAQLTRALERAADASGKQRRAPSRVGGVDCAPGVAKQLHALRMAAHARRMQGRRVEPLHGVHVHLAQKLVQSMAVAGVRRLPERARRVEATR